MKVSVCYIVKNEAQFLEESLRSVQRLASEMILVDSGSTDQTLEIARKFKCRIESFKWSDDFSAARNFAAEFATCDWILFVDGDEVLESEGADKILRVISSATDTVAFGVLQRNYTSDRSFPNWKSVDAQNAGEIYHDLRGLQGFSDNLMMKLYRNHRGLVWEGPVHETFVGSCRRLGLRHEEIPICILHHLNALKSESFRSEKKLYYLKLSMEKLKSDPTHENSWFEIGIALNNLGHFTEAERAFREALIRRPDWAEAKLFYGRTLLRLDRNAEAEALFRDLLMDPECDWEASGHLSTALLYQGKVREAEEWIRNCFERGVQHLALHVNAGVIFFEKKDFVNSLSHLKRAQEMNPADPFLRDAIQKTNSVLKV